MPFSNEYRGARIRLPGHSTSATLRVGALAAGDLGREGIEVRFPEPAEPIEPCVDIGDHSVDLDLLASRIVDDEVLRAGRP